MNQIETAAWGERFGRNILDFKTPVKNPDKRFKRWFQCTHCYAHWVLGTADGGRAASAGPEDATGVSAPEAVGAEPGAGNEGENDEEDPFGFGPSSFAGEDVEQPAVWPSGAPLVQVPSSKANAPPAADGQAGGATAAARAAPKTPPRGAASNTAELTPSRSARRGDHSTEPAAAAPLPPTPPLPIAAPPVATQESMRALNLLLQRLGGTAVWTDAMTDARAGVWSSEASELATLYTTTFPS